MTCQQRVRRKRNQHPTSEYGCIASETMTSRAAHLVGLGWVHARRSFALLVAAGAQVQEHVVGVHLQQRVLRGADVSTLNAHASHTTKPSHLRFGATKKR